MAKKYESKRKYKYGKSEGSNCLSARLHNLQLYEGFCHSPSRVVVTNSTNNADITFEQLLIQWEKQNEIRLKGGTHNKYSNLIYSHIIPKLGEKKLSEITTPYINSYLTDCIKNGRLDGRGGLSASYVRSIALIISSALKYAASEDMCKPLTSKISKPSIAKITPSILSLEIQRVLVQQITANLTPTNVGIMISLYTGLRLGEVCALAWEDIDFNNSIIYVQHTVSRVKATDSKTKTVLILDEPKTLSSKRVVPIPSTLFSVLVAYRHISTSLFVVSDKTSFISPRTFESRFHKVLEDSNIPDINYHSLRHTFATRCIEAGVDVKSLSEILGHSNVSITLNTYVHSSLEMKKNQIEKLARLSL